VNISPESALPILGKVALITALIIDGFLPSMSGFALMAPYTITLIIGLA
jgi:hypothetical protein